MGDLAGTGNVMRTEVFTNVGCCYPTGTYTLTFDGSGTVEIYDGVDPVESFSQYGGLGTPNNVTISKVTTQGIIIGIAASNPTDYVRNIRLVMPGYQNTYETQPFYPPYLAELQPFSRIRFVQWQGINSPTQEVGLTWSQETPVTYMSQAASTGVNVAYMVDLCNELNKDMWVNMPVGSDSTYDANFATYVLDNLKPGLKVYVEYGNEVWNAYSYPHEWQYVANYETTNDIAGYWSAEAILTETAGTPGCRSSATSPIASSASFLVNLKTR